MNDRLHGAGERGKRGTLQMNTEELFSRKLISRPVPLCRNHGFKKALRQKVDTYIKQEFAFHLYPFYLC